MIKSLGYFGVSGADLPDWADFATNLLGMQIADRTATTMALRMDDRQQRLVLNADSAERSYFFGWEVADAAALEDLASRLEANHVQVRREPESIAAQRCVKDLISFSDPAGNRLEAFWSLHRSPEPFEPGRNISGFRTGQLGLGHAVLAVERIEQVLPFYQDVLGFQLSDYTLAPFKAFFFHINRRHHSLALVETGKNGLHHLMVELCSMDDVGQAYDLAQGGEGCVGVTLGRHSNDLMTSFYARSPSGFLVEYGWGGADIGPADLPAKEYTCGPSLWGHERDWLPPEKREEARELRLRAAAEGLRHPVQVLDGFYKVTA